MEREDEFYIKQFSWFLSDGLIQIGLVQIGLVQIGKPAEENRGHSMV
jgi:hypothetical protein